MDAGAPWMEALVQGDLPIVELTNSDLFGLDKEDDNLGNQDFGVIEPLVEITSPERQLENVDNLSEGSFCMLEPEVHIDPPETHMDDDMEDNVDEPGICTNDLGVDYDESDVQMPSAETGDRTPSPELLEPLVQIKTQDVEIIPQEITRDSPEIVTIEDTPEKFHDNELMHSPVQAPVKQLFDSNSDCDLKELRIKLIKIDETLTIINNAVRLPGHMCDSDADNTSNSNGHQSSRASSLSSRTCRERTATNQRSPYSLRIKPEPADDDEEPSYSNAVRFNPYALSAQKTNKRNPVSAKGKQAKNRRTQKSQPDDPDDFLPTDFLEASMSEGLSPSGSQGSGSLLQKTLTLVGKKHPGKIELNGSASSAVQKTKGAPERLSSFRSGFVAQASGSNSLETLAKVMANSSLSLTHRPKPGAPVRKLPGQTGMVNHDHQYSSRLSNENVTRLETQIKTLISENRVLKVETETLRKQLVAANTYIATSLNTAVNPPPVRAPPQPRAFRAQAQAFSTRAQNFRAPRPPAARAAPIRTQAVRAAPNRAQALRVQAIFPPTRPTLQQRKANPGVVVIPARLRAAIQPTQIRPLHTSTSALSVIPIKKAPRVPEPEGVMPAFEQVNVNEHFGMHFLTE